MDRQYIETNHIVDRYLLGQLSETEAAEFEAFYFEHEDIFEEVRIQKAMQESLAQEMRPVRTKPVPASALQNWLDRLMPVGLARAAAAVLAVAVIALLMQNIDLREQEDVLILTDVASVTLAQVRGDSVPVVVLPAAAISGGIRLSTNLGPVGYSKVQLRLSREGGTWSWSAPAKIDPVKGTIDLVLSPGTLQRGTYRLTVSTAANGQSVQLAEYVFRISD